jgi:tripartite-type tricarboxylate transporter receptor subunit TctC
MNCAHRQFAGAVVTVFLATLSSDVTWSQTTRPIRIVVPTTPGSSLDFVARILGEQIGKAQGRRWWSRTARERAM